MHIEEVTAPATSSVLLAEVKEHMRIDSADEDTYLSALVAASERMIEAVTGLSLISRTYNLYTGDSIDRNKRSVRMPVRPVIDINSIHIIGSDGSETLLPDSAYSLEKGLSPTLSFNNSENWFSLLGPPAKLRINVMAGFGDNWNTVPANIRQALLLLITSLYFSRGDVERAGDQMMNLMKTSGAWALLSSYRQVRL